MPRRKKSVSPDIPGQPSSRDVSPTIITKFKQTSRGLVCQFTMNGQTIWEEELVSAAGQPITCLKNLPGDLTGDVDGLYLDDTQRLQTRPTRQQGVDAANSDSRRGNSIQEKNHRKPSTDLLAQKSSSNFTATPLQPSFLPKQHQSSLINNHSSPLAPDTGGACQLSILKTSIRSLSEAEPAPASDITTVTIAAPKAKRLDMSFRELLRRTTTYGRREDRDHRERRENRDTDHSHHSRGHRDGHGHHRHEGRSGRDSRHRDENDQRSLRHRYHANNGQERDHRPHIEVPVTFDEEYFCYGCGRLRSVAFRTKYPLQPGQLPKANFCLKCRFNAEEDGRPLSFRGLQYYCFGCGILRSANYHNENRQLGRDEMCPPNFCNKCREASLSWDDSIILQSEVAPVAREIHSPGRRDDLYEIAEEREDGAEHDSPSSVEIEPSPVNLRGINRNADLLESRRERAEPEPEPVQVTEPIAPTTSGAHHGPTVESEVDSEPELRAAQPSQEAQANNDNARSVATPTNEGIFTPETGNDSPDQPEQISDQINAVDHDNPQSSRDWHPRDIGTQTDKASTPPAMRERAPSATKSVHWPSDEEISTSQEDTFADPSRQARSFNNNVRSEHGPAVDQGRYAQTRHSHRDPGAFSNGSPVERHDWQTRDNTGGPTNRQYDRGSAFANHNGSHSRGAASQSVPVGNASPYAGAFTQGHDNDDSDLPSPSATLTGMPIPTHLLNPGFYSGPAARARAARASMARQARSQHFDDQMPDDGVPNFSMPMNPRDHERSRNVGPSSPSWGPSHENAQNGRKGKSPFTMRNEDDNDDGVPVPDVSTTCECDFDAVFKDMPKPDMNDEFYSHRPTDSDLEAVTRYAKSIVDGIDAAHRRQNEDTQEDNEVNGSSSGRPHMPDEAATGHQSAGNPSDSVADEHFHSSIPSAQSNQDHGRRRGGPAGQTYAATR